MILSLFSSCGGLDLGFEMAGFRHGLAIDIRPYSISSWNRNRPDNPCGHVADIKKLGLADLDKAYGARFAPTAIIGGPPCQSFTRANHFRFSSDPRSKLIETFFTVALRLHRHRRPLEFIVMENVRELAKAESGKLLKNEITRLKNEGFIVWTMELNARDFGVPQNRHRLFLVAFNKDILAEREFIPPTPHGTIKTVYDEFAGLPEPVHYSAALENAEFPFHPNHWCMTPKSRRFFDGSLKAGYCSSRSFKTLAWDQPSIAVSYGHREVHVHPSGKRRLSVFEAMLLQGFPKSFVLDGTLSAQIDQVSEAVPPPLANAVALAVRKTLAQDHTMDLAKTNKSSNSANAESV